MKVNFLLIGAAKSATTSLSAGLAQHPDICFSTPKEPDFFNRADWRLQLDDYHSLFKKSAKLYGEGSTNYSKYPRYNKNIVSDIYEYNSDMKIIYIMRHPIDRLLSYYIHSYNRGYETINDVNIALKTGQHYIDTGKYAMQIEPYIKTFGKSNVLLLFFEDFINDPKKTTNQVFDFLHLPLFVLNSKSLNINKSFNRRTLHHKYDDPKSFGAKLNKLIQILRNYSNSDFIDQKPLISEATKAYVIEHCKEDILKIEKIAQRDLSHWMH
ncbi:sulfotransferase family protein [Winogradskyella luteola]|uniref:Sulfotransferase n=1 Tax=Winogradskyella luteola TaxID=2828330 RepID=A0A9X1FB95_9FLAO|nr:sulfotransferase [Winogradskyella luteola]MBV7269465.1 sulfotransferase [Winogradskyella luteola]